MCECRYRTYVESAPDAIFVTGWDVNRAACFMTQYSRSELLSMGFCDLVLQTALDDWVEKRGTMLRDESLNAATVLTGKNGHAIHISVHSSRLSDDRFLSFCSDVTSQVEMEHLLDETHTRFETFRENIPNGIVMRDSQGVIVDVNRAACTIFGLSKKKVIGKRLLDFIHLSSTSSSSSSRGRGHIPGEKDALPSVRNLSGLKMDEKEEEKLLVHGDTCISRSDGTQIAVALNFVPLSEERSIYFLTDISEKKKSEEERTMLEMQLLHSQRMEAMGRLAGGVAHDFNNLLTAIMGNIQLMLEGYISPKDTSETLMDVLSASERAAELTKQLLAFSRKQVIRPKVVNLNHVIGSMMKLLSRTMSKDIEMVVDLNPSGANVTADPSQMEQVVLNLVVNACDAMPEGGKLSISTTVRAGSSLIDSGVVDMTSSPSARSSDVWKQRGSKMIEDPSSVFSILEVRDSGEGIRDDVLDKVFEPFFTTKPEGRGTGLGLATVMGIVEQNKGYIDVQTHIGEGTCFRLVFPRATKKDDTNGKGRRRLHGDALNELRGEETILVVEDDLIVQKVAVKVLQKKGYHVIAKKSGQEALDWLRNPMNAESRVDLLLSDVVMPGMNGVELSKEVVLLRPNIKVLFCSGYAYDIIAHHGVVHEGVNFIEKPYRPRKLAKRVRTLLDGTSGGSVDSSP